MNSAQTITRKPYTSLRKLSANDVEKHPAFDQALVAAKVKGNLPNGATVAVWSSADNTERVILTTDSSGCLFVELFRYDARRFVTAHGRLNIGATRFFAGSGRMILISKYATRGTAAWFTVFDGSFGL